MRWRIGSAGNHIFGKIRAFFMNIPNSYVELNSSAFRLTLKEEILKSLQLLIDNEEMSDDEKLKEFANFISDLIKIEKLNKVSKIINEVLNEEYSVMFLPIKQDLREAQKARIALIENDKFEFREVGYFVESYWNFSKLKIKIIF